MPQFIPSGYSSSFGQSEAEGIIREVGQAATPVAGAVATVADAFRKPGKRRKKDAALSYEGETYEEEPSVLPWVLGGVALLAVAGGGIFLMAQAGGQTPAKAAA